MTMLDRMRRHKSWLKWSLGIVVVSFIVLYIPQFLSPSGPNGAAAPSDVIATVEGRRVTAAAYQQAYQQQVDQLRAAYGNVTEAMLQQLAIPQRVVQQLVNQEVVLAEANRLGITVSDGELRERLLRLPMFQENGQFVGEAAYRQMLDQARPPVRPADFENDLRRSLIAEKLQAAVTGWINVSDADVEREYRRQNEKVKLDLAVFTADKFRAGITPTDAEIAARFSSHQEAYRIPEKRRVRYLAIDAEALRSTVTVTPQEIQARYNDNLQAYTTPEQIRASHILFKTDGKDAAAVRKVAESVLAKVKAGGDFAALAKQYSEDDGSKANGGDLGFFGRGAMVKEFEDAAWALQPGQVSGIVQTPFGFHIIKVTDKRAASTRTLDEVRQSIEDTLRDEKARAEASQLASTIAPTIKTPADLDTAAKAHGLTVGDSGLFARNEPLAGLGFAPAVTASAFSLQKDQVSGELATNQGYAFIAVTDIQPSTLPTLDQVKDKVKDDVIHDKALAIARSKAEAMAKAAGSNFARAARAAGVDVKSTDMVTRGSSYPEIGVSDAVDAAVFKLAKGETSGPIETGDAVVVARVADRQDISPDALAAQRETIRQQLFQQRADAFFSAYLAKIRSGMEITYNQATLEQLTKPS
jgi:peptidyl-prolyl cis-trans isomerase D